MKYLKWLNKNTSNLKGKIIVITGANSGIGYYASLYLAYQGAKIIMACRNLQKANIARENILKEVPHADLEIRELNVASLQSIKLFKEGLFATYNHLDGLINNAGVYNMPKETTIDGFEITMGTNYLGTYALTCQLFPLLIKSNDARIVNVSSIVHKAAKINYDDFFANKARRTKIYANSKLAILTFSEYLGNYCQKNYPNILVCAAHPGVSATNLFAPKSGGFSVWFSKLASGFLKLFTHRPQKASLSLVYAFANEKVKVNDYYGPRGLFEISGFPCLNKKAKTVYSNHDKLMQISQSLTNHYLVENINKNN